jgi:hypothetical protein
MRMIAQRLRSLSAVTVAVCLAVLLGGAWAVLAAAPPSNVIKGCAAGKAGTLRIITGKAKCKRGERAVSWNKKGVTGPAGAIGNFDSLDDRPCAVGTPRQGKLDIARNANTGVQTLLCVPDSGVPLESTAQLQPGVVDASALDPALFGWVTQTTHAKVNIVAEFHRLLDPTADSRLQRFNDNLVYEIHVARGGTSLADVVTYRLRFTTPAAPIVDPADQGSPPGGGKEPLDFLTGRVQTYSLTELRPGVSPVTIASGVPVAPPNLGQKAFDIYKFFHPGTAQPAYNDAFAAEFITTGTNGIRVWAGPRDEAEYADLGALRGGLQFRAQGTAKDSYAGFNALTVVLEIPAGQLTTTGSPVFAASDVNTLGLWASTSVPVEDVLGNTVNLQVARAGQPMFDELFIGEQDKRLYASTQPDDDVLNLANFILNPVLVRDAEAVGGFYPLNTAPANLKFGRADVIDVFNIKNFPTTGAHNINTIGDVLRVDLGVDNSYPNGRPIPGGATATLPADAPDLLYSLLLFQLSSPVSDGVVRNDASYLSGMPWSPLPWSYLTTSHGVTTP